MRQTRVFMPPRVLRNSKNASTFISLSIYLGRAPLVSLRELFSKSCIGEFLGERSGAAEPSRREIFLACMGGGGGRPWTGPFSVDFAFVNHSIHYV